DMPPPCASTIAFAIERPSPAPGTAADWACAVRKKRSKSNPCSFSGMPTPVSATSIRTPSPWAKARTSTRPPAGVNLSAFETRLSITWPIRVGSAETVPSSSVFPSSTIPRAVATGTPAWTQCSIKVARSTSVVLALCLAKQLVAVLLGRLGGRDVDREALGVPRLPRRVADDRIAVAQPDDPAVARHEAVLQLERLAALASSALSFAHALSVRRMQMVGEEVRECPPLVDRVPEDLVDLRADVGGRPVRARGRVDVRDQRQLFDERAVAALDGVGAALLAEPVG